MTGKSSRLPPTGEWRPARLWTVAEAEAELPRLRQSLRGIQQRLKELGEIQEELARLARFWGAEFESEDHPDAASRDRLQERVRRLTLDLQHEVEALHREGIELKDPEVGLVDFYAMRHGELVYLCWKMDEEGILAWHTLDGGFRGRQALTWEERQLGLERS
jgi:hypothetical protein